MTPGLAFAAGWFAGCATIIAGAAVVRWHMMRQLRRAARKGKPFHGR